MFSLSIMLGSGQWRLMFKTEETARACATAIENPSRGTQIVDDFGQEISIVAASYHGMMLEDMDKSQAAAIELALHNARMNKKATTMAQSDPALKQSMIGQPGIVAPMGRPQF